MQSSSIKVFKKNGYVVLSNIYDNSITQQHEVFASIAEQKPHTLILNNLDGNALFYYIRKNNFPTVKKVIYFDDYSPQDTDGLYNFDKILVTRRFNKHFAGKNFDYMKSSDETYYKEFTDKLDNKLKNSLSIVTTDNAKTYFDFIQTPPLFEVIDE